MSKFYLYNGVKLPALPEWDKTVYPYAFIYAFGTNDNGAVSEVCTLVVSSSNQMVYDSIGIGFRYDDIGIGKTISADKTQWVDWTWSSGGSEYFYVKRDEPTDILYIRIVWANFDVLNANGSVYVAASDPVPVADKFSLQGWLNWYVIGLCSRPLPVSVREPVAYLYNGVRLPPIPAEVMKNLYIYIFQSVEGKQYIVYGFDAKPITVSVPSFFGSAIEKLRVESGTYASANWYSTIPEDWTGIETNQNPSDAALGYVESNLSGVVWANFDVHTSDSTLYLAASDPIPVYE